MKIYSGPGAIGRHREIKRRDALKFNLWLFVLLIIVMLSVILSHYMGWSNING